VVFSRLVPFPRRVEGNKFRGLIRSLSKVGRGDSLDSEGFSVRELLLDLGRGDSLERGRFWVRGLFEGSGRISLEMERFSSRGFLLDVGRGESLTVDRLIVRGVSCVRRMSLLLDPPVNCFEVAGVAGTAFDLLGLTAVLRLTLLDEKSVSGLVKDESVS
jgi:hypothetical protein